MPRLLVTLALVSLLSSGAARARADDDPERTARARRGWVTYLLQPEQPVVWLSSTEAWSSSAPAAGSAPLSVCDGRRRCVPIVRLGSCVAPQCPGAGVLFVVAAPPPGIAVEPFPEDDEEDWNEAVGALAADEVVGGIVRAVRVSYPHESDDGESSSSAAEDQWLEHDGQVRYELSAGASAQYLATAGAGAFGASFRLGIYYSFATDSGSSAPEVMDDILQADMGDYVGGEIRVHALERTNEPNGATVVGIGLAPGLYNAIEDSAWRVPAFMDVVFPEVGLFFGGPRSPAVYVRFAPPFAVLVDESIALELTPSLTILDAWVDGDGAEVLFGVTVGAVLR